jgi:hypothetical protein
LRPDLARTWPRRRPGRQRYDSLWGGADKDSILSAVGRDVVVGQGQRDIIAGEVGDDFSISGKDGRGGDQLRGGPGDDFGDADAATPSPRWRMCSGAAVAECRPHASPVCEFLPAR